LFYGLAFIEFDKDSLDDVGALSLVSSGDCRVRDCVS
jgi:hypothetical protein